MDDRSNGFIDNNDNKGIIAKSQYAGLVFRAAIFLDLKRDLRLISNTKHGNASQQLGRGAKKFDQVQLLRLQSATPNQPLPLARAPGLPLKSGKPLPRNWD